MSPHALTPSAPHSLLELWNQCGAIKRYSRLYLEIIWREAARVLRVASLHDGLEQNVWESKTEEGRAPKMDSFTVPPELKGTKGDILAARIEVPILVAMIYGIVEFVRLGWSRDFYLYTYGPVLGGVAATIGLFAYLSVVSEERKKSRKDLLVLLGFLPYSFAVYVMGVLGLYNIFEGLIGEFSLWSMIGGIFWVFLGFHLIYRFYRMTEIVRKHDQKTKLAWPL